MLYEKDDRTEEAYGAAHTIEHVATTVYELIDTAGAHGHNGYTRRHRNESTTPKARVQAAHRRHGRGRGFSGGGPTRPRNHLALFIVSLDEIEAWIKRKGLKGGAS